MKPEPEYRESQTSAKRGGRVKVDRSYPADCFDPHEVDMRLVPEGYDSRQIAPCGKEYTVHMHRRRTA